MATSSRIYRTLYTREARRNIDKLSLDKKRQIKNSIERIAADPEIGKHLAGELKGLQSYRSGAYRIIYRVHRREIMIVVLTIGHRKDVYKQTNKEKACLLVGPPAPAGTTAVRLPQDRPIVCSRANANRT